ncbi:tyrosine--tRNA ligase [Aquisphaera insulae]|uniref:tyrosine--tRNA ligase n=1 Tax=Aquisphaera insulae TaxID=2712864 RepID=UPI0013EDAC24|nr:tyrosine--tRNA ligase [Aquisphaera insulae]
MTRLADSIAQTAAILEGADLASDLAVRELLDLTTRRRSLDLSDLSPDEQSALIAGRSQELQPSPKAMAERIVEAGKAGRPFIAKFGIDPTGHEVHLGHAVPMLILSRFQRMGHLVVFIVGDVTAKIGDPSGRSDERPALTDEDIARNLATYRDQVRPFFDFDRAQFRHNGDWLRDFKLPRLVEITARIPVSMPLQREDFRKRLEAGHGLSLAELLYSVVMALDSVEIHCDVEIGGIDQFLNMQMCRKVMEVCGQRAELVVATALIEGTDGAGTKMSKSRGNYVPLTAPAGEIYGKIMSVPDRLAEPYFRALSEWSDRDLAIVNARLAGGSLRPVDLKKILAGEVTAALHGVDAAMRAREEFEARFSRRSFEGAGDLPVIDDLGQSVIEAVKSLGFAKSNSEARRVAGQNGIRLVIESAGEQDQVVLTAEEALEPFRTVIEGKLGGRTGSIFLKVGRKLASVRSR